jgi:hypothetical protein
VVFESLLVGKHLFFCLWIYYLVSLARHDLKQRNESCYLLEIAQEDVIEHLVRVVSKALVISGNVTAFHELVVKLSLRYTFEQLEDQEYVVLTNQPWVV